MSSAVMDAVNVERDGDIVVISLMRPEAMNAVNDAIRFGLVEACTRAAHDPDIRAVLIRAEGDRAFCVGADIKESRVAPSEADTRSPPADRDYTTAIAAMAKPVICAIHGFCLGAGLEIALACDIRIATPQASFGLPEVNLGLIPGAGGTQRLTRLIGMARALDMMLTGDRMAADRACDVGLITRIAADRGALETQSRSLAHALAAKPPLALTYLKEVVRAGMDISLTAGLARERELFAILKTTDDAREAAEAFKEKRPGHFTGR